MKSSATTHFLRELLVNTLSLLLVPKPQASSSAARNGKLEDSTVEHGHETPLFLTASIASFHTILDRHHRRYFRTPAYLLSLDVDGKPHFRPHDCAFHE